MTPIKSDFQNPFGTMNYYRYVYQIKMLYFINVIGKYLFNFSTRNNETYLQHNNVHNVIFK